MWTPESRRTFARRGSALPLAVYRTQEHARTVRTDVRRSRTCAHQPNKKNNWRLVCPCSVSSTGSREADGGCFKAHTGQTQSFILHTATHTHTLPTTVQYTGQVHPRTTDDISRDERCTFSLTEVPPIIRRPLQLRSINDPCVAYNEARRSVSK